MLTVKDLHKSYQVGKTTYEVLKGVSLTVEKGEFVAVMGPSGSGKTTLLNCISCYIPINSGEIMLGDRQLANLSEDALAKVRNRQLGFVFQDFLLLDGLTVRENILLPAIIGGAVTGQTEARADQLCDVFGISAIRDKYPAEISGGEKQRTAVARALMTHPDLIVCDEPVSALDASVQAQILNLLRQVQEDFGPAYLFISHDLAVVGFMCPHILVMYLGRFVEEGPRERLLREPAHPYTRALLASVPSFEDLRDGKSPVRAAQQNIRGELPSPLDPPSGCRFHPRCPQATERCRAEAPQWKELEPGWRVRCHLYG